MPEILISAEVCKIIKCGGLVACKGAKAGLPDLEAMGKVMVELAQTIVDGGHFADVVALADKALALCAATEGSAEKIWSDFFDELS